MPEKKYYLTEEGLKKAKQEYEELKERRRKEIRENAPENLSSEDTDPEHISFRKEIGFLDAKIAKLEEVLRSAEITKPPPGKCKEVQVGARVTVEANGQVGEFSLVGTLEADPTLGKISDESPVGKALLGKKEGEEVAVSSPVKTIYKIKKVEYPSF